MIKRRLLMVAAALAMGVSVAGAQERFGPPGPRAGLLPAHEIITILRSTGFEPIGRPVKVGAHYKVQAFDPEDFEVRLLVDGRTGRILTVRDNDEAWPMRPVRDGDGAWPMRPPPPYPHAGFHRSAGRFGPLSYGPLYPGGLAPPRGIPARRSSAKVDPQKAPVPRSRPDSGRERTAATGTPGAPTTPGMAAKRSPGTATVAIKAPPTGASKPGKTLPDAANAGIKGSIGAESSKKPKTTSTAANTAPPHAAASRNTPGGPPAPDAAAPAKTDKTIKIVPVAPLE